MVARVVSSAGMKTHVDFLGLLHVVWGALFGLVGVAVLALAIGAAAILRSAPAHQGAEVAAGLTALTFTVIGAVSLFWAIVHLWCGLALRRHRAWARVCALALAGLNLFFLPFGTLLGVYALWVLLNNDSRALFERPETTPA